MTLKNYRSEAPLLSIFRDIEKTLVDHGAKQVARSYDGQGRTTEISFVVETKSGPLGIRLPARFDRVEAIFKDQNIPHRPDQPYRTTWATIRDWLSAQMALLDWEMVKLEEIFLPYAVGQDGQTFFEVVENKGFLLGHPPGDTQSR